MIVKTTSSPRILIRTTRSERGPVLYLKRAGDHSHLVKLTVASKGVDGYVAIDGVPSQMPDGSRFEFTIVSLAEHGFHDLIKNCLGPLDFSRRAPTPERAA